MLRIILATLGFLAATGCEWANEPVEKDDPVVDETGDDPSGLCPSGMVAADDASMVLNSFTWGGLATVVSWSDDPDLAGGTPACVSTTGSSGQWRLVGNGEALGTLLVTAPGPGSYPNPNVGMSFTVSLPNADPPGTVSGGSWTSGAIEIVDSGGVLTITGNNLAGPDPNGIILYLNFTAAGSR
jgi:hypothetical protein